MFTSKKIEIVMGHRISEHKEKIGPYSNITVYPQELENYIRYRLDLGWKKIYPNELQTYTYKKKYVRCSNNGFILTFDDGYRNNLTILLPILEKYNVPCIIFVTTGFVENNMLPYEVILSKLIIQLEKILLMDGSVVELHSHVEKQSFYEELRKKIKVFDTQKRYDYIRQLSELNNISYQEIVKSDNEFLSWDELLYFNEHPLVWIGAHTHTHPILTKISVRNAYNEIKHSKNKLEQELGEDLHFFSYPYGANSFLVRKMVKNLGFKYAFTTRQKYMKTGEKLDCYAIPRFDLNNIVGGNNY